MFARYSVWSSAQRVQINQTRELISSASQNPFNAVGQTPSAVSRLLRSYHSTMKAWLMECCWDGRPFGTLSHLYRSLFIFVTVTVDLFVASLTEALSPSCWTPGVLLLLHFFHFTVMEATVLLETLKALETLPVPWCPMHRHNFNMKFYRGLKAKGLNAFTIWIWIFSFWNFHLVIMAYWAETDWNTYQLLSF